MYTKANFTQAIADTIDKYPAIAALYRAGDPRILQNLEAQATMLAMLSSQIEVAMAEPFEKVRDATVLADAAMRGIILKATPGRVRVLATNGGDSSFTVESGRVIFDSLGNPYIAETSAVIAAAGTGTVYATQVKHDIITHAVTGSAAFYAIEIPASDDGSYLSGIAVSDAAGEYEHRERYVNTWPDERIFHVEADDKQRVYVRFGQTDIVGTQPLDGQVITLTISRTQGEISPAFGSPFSFDYLQSPLESSIVLTMDALEFKGQNPPDMATLRELAKYPSVYDHSAVFLGEFDFLVRRNFPVLQFLSIWNESVEERVRGASLDNINTLFVACLDQTETTLTETETPLLPVKLTELTGTQQAIMDTIKKADDSYRVYFFTPIRSEIGITINAVVSSSFIASDVQSKITETLLATFGQAAAGSRRGSSQPLYQQIYALLKAGIPALSSGRADMTLTIADPVGGYRPELWRYVTANSLTINITTANVVLPSWGG